MVGPSTMTLLLIVLLVNQSYELNIFQSFKMFGFLKCPPLTNCYKNCIDGYEKTLFGCEVCRCRIDLCKNFVCVDGYSCKSTLQIGWFYLSRAHCAKDVIPMDRLVPPLPSTTTTTTTTTTTPRPTTKLPTITCDHGQIISSCSIIRSCRNTTTEKCIIFNSYGQGVCCLKEAIPLRSLPTKIPGDDDMDKPRCMQSASVGPCRGMVPRYFYNVTKGVCQKFNYGGCKENENNFKSMHDCQETCVNPCNLTPIAGRCRAAIVRYFYNSTTEQCESFTFGGCQGNGNNWRSLKECEQMCTKNRNSFFMGNNNLNNKDRKP